MALAVTSGSTEQQSPTATNAHDPVTSERGGLSPYRAVEPWLFYYYIILTASHANNMLGL
jgi:hypothetical protein